MQKPKLGISTCLLGENVRYDGGHKLDKYLRDTLGQFVDYVPVCPEVECGLPIPREAIRLVGDPENPKLMTQKTGIDHTQRMQSWAVKRLDELERENLCGYVFKAKSPSSGMRDIKVYNEKGLPTGKGVGMFARVFMERFPLMPVEDEGRLNDSGLRDSFITRIFVYHRWRNFVTGDASIKGLVEFHTDHKLLIMAHNPRTLYELGSMVARHKQIDREVLFSDYLALLMKSLKLSATIKKNVNVLQHIMGYFKKQISSDEKQELLDVISSYHQGLVPLIVPVTLLNHYTRKYQENYLLRQVYLHPHPLELMLRNYV
ncbi:DUF523 and DUF1722 domain-containing protein [candidate division KSB1 bacterium]|nr:DUF523 and DUF1722 domain-containing protein [candidate division KSB1 bacterium]